MGIKILQNRKEYGSRLEQVRKETGLNIEDFAEKLGVKAIVIREMEKCRYNPGYNLIMKLNEVYHINPNYILLGEGGMFLDGKQPGPGYGLEVSWQSDDMEKLYRAMKRSRLLRFAVLSFVLTYQANRKDLIDLDIENSENC